MNRWKMHRLGFVNFWLYDTEEFLLEDGHILLRGANGSGKSITTQSFIPFLLDGNRSPERLDPFGSKDRKMDFYLLGEGDDLEATGYLYLEFKKDGLEQYLAVCIGMRAKKGKGIDFWGFCLGDGRRIGFDEFQLCEKVGDKFLSLTKLQLKHLLDDPENWAEAPGAYKRLVNDRVFGFRDLRQYDQLIQLLIKVRAPKLSKEAFRPSEVKTILNDSLQVLTDEDLSAMVSAMEQMDSLGSTLEDYRIALRDAGTLRTEYLRYNHFILGFKGKRYLAAAKNMQSARKELDDKKERLEQQQAELFKQEGRREQAEALLAQAKAQRADMGEDDLTAKQRLLSELRQSEHEHKKQLDEQQAQLEKKQQAAAKKEREYRDYKQEENDLRRSLHRDMEEIDRHNGVLALEEAHRHYIGALQRERLGVPEQQALRAALSGRRKQINDTLDCLREARQAQNIYDAACQALDRAQMDCNQAKSALRDAERLEQEERDNLIEAIVRWQTYNEAFCLDEESLLTLRQMAARYHSSADWNALNGFLNAQYQPRYDGLSSMRAGVQQALMECRKKTENLRHELRLMRERSEPVPPRSPQVEAARMALAMRDIPHAAFYETIDFSPDLPQEARDLLEAQLMDAGLLDALVVPEEDHAKMEISCGNSRIDLSFRGSRCRTALRA